MGRAIVQVCACGWPQTAAPDAHAAAQTFTKKTSYTSALLPVNTPVQWALVWKSLLVDWALHQSQCGSIFFQSYGKDTDMDGDEATEAGDV